LEERELIRSKIDIKIRALFDSLRTDPDSDELGMTEIRELYKKLDPEMDDNKFVQF